VTRAADGPSPRARVSRRGAGNKEQRFAL